MPTIQFKKFRPNSDLAKHAETMVLQLADEVPIGAVIRAYVARLKEEYQCCIEVIFQSQRFAQNARCQDPSQALSEVNKKLKNDLMKWKLEHLELSEPSFWNYKEIQL